MMGCLAALSLAGCGGSGSGGSGASSSGPSERLINEGYSSVVLNAFTSGSTYYYTLKSDGTCKLWPHYPKDIRFEGRWTAEFLGAGETPESGKFKITFGAFSLASDPLGSNCKIDHISEITLTITDMSAYRRAALNDPVEAEFDKVPYTHQAGTGCTYQSAVGMKLTVANGTE